MQLTKDNVQLTVIELINDVIQSWGEDPSESITEDTYLIADLDLASVDFIQLIVSIEERFKKKLGFHDLLMPDDKYINDLMVGDLVEFTSQKLQSVSVNYEANNLLPKITHVEESERLNADKLALFRQQFPTPKREPNLSVSKNPKSVFVLTAPRSASTLLRVILGGHPALFSPPELHLLDYETLSQRKKALSNELNSHLLEGSIRAIMSLNQCSAENAQQLMNDYENQGLTTKEFYHQLQQLLGGRLLVDKTPTYAFHLKYLQCAEAEFDEPLYIHLVRHPYGMIRSFEDAKIDQLIPFMRESSLSRRELAEALWFIVNDNIRTFFQTVPAHRQFRVTYESLVAAPEVVVRQICDFLSIDFHPDMLNPYKDKEQRMTDGVFKTSRFSGDLKFHLHQNIAVEAANRWEKFHTSNFLGDITWKLANSFGYEE